MSFVIDCKSKQLFSNRQVLLTLIPIITTFFGYFIEVYTKETLG